MKKADSWTIDDIMEGGQLSSDSSSDKSNSSSSSSGSSKSSKKGRNSSNSNSSKSKKSNREDDDAEETDSDYDKKGKIKQSVFYDEGDGHWYKGYHDLLALGLSKTPYSRYYFSYLSEVILNDFSDPDDGPNWYIEKQVNRCCGGIISNDYSFLIKYDQERFNEIVNLCKPFGMRNFPDYESEVEEPERKMVADRMK